MTRICITLTVLLLALPVLAQNKPTKPDTTNVISTRDPSALVSAMNKAWLDGLTKNNIKPSEIADGSEFLRRVYFELTGRVPSAGGAPPTRGLKASPPSSPRPIRAASRVVPMSPFSIAKPCLMV